MRKPLPDGNYYAIFDEGGFRIKGNISFRLGISISAVKIKDPGNSIWVECNDIKVIYENKNKKEKFADYRLIFKTKAQLIAVLFEKLVK